MNSESGIDQKGFYGCEGHKVKVNCELLMVNEEKKTTIVVVVVITAYLCVLDLIL